MISTKGEVTPFTQIGFADPAAAHFGSRHIVGTMVAVFFAMSLGLLGDIGAD
jgi:hypothetical protein